MRLKREECKKLATHCGQFILNDPQVTLKAPKASILSAIETALSRHFEEEKQIEDQAEKLYAERGAEFGSLDKGKALSMIRKQLAAEKNFVLSGGPTRFSEDKIYHLAHIVADKLYDDDLVDFVDEDEGPKYFKRIFLAYFQRENEIGEKVRKKLSSMANVPFEGSREWDVLYRKFFEEEMKRLGHV